MLALAPPASPALPFPATLIHMTTRTQLTALAVATTLAAASSASAQAIIESFTSVARLNNPGSPNTWSVSGTTGTPPDTLLVAGRASSPSSQLFMTVVSFDISDLRAQIEAAPSVTFSIAVSAFGGTGTNLTASLFTKPSSTIVGGDATATATSAGTINFNDLGSAPGVVTFNITSVAQSLLDTNSTDNFLFIRLTSQYAPSDANAGRNVQFYTLNTLANQANGGAYLTIIPEPSAFAALAGLGALGFAASRRRRR